MIITVIPAVRTLRIRPPRYLAVCLLVMLAAAAGAQGLEIRATEAPAAVAPPPASLDGLDALYREVRTRIAQGQRPVPQGALPRASKDVAEVWLAMAALQLEKARDQQAAGRAQEAGKNLQAARELLAVKAPEAMPQAVRYGRLLELAYIADNDASPQPYFLYLPSRYDGTKPFPLILFLHGWVPTTSRTDPYLVSDFVLDMAERHQALFVIPHGRTNTDFQYAGEVDVLRVKKEMEAFFKVDPERVYLLGVSMGGAGAWQVAAHYPDLFAATAPINGQADWFRFWHEKFNYPARAELPAHIATLVALNNPLDLAANFTNLYSYSQHATRCFVGVGHTKAMVDRFQALGAPYETYEDPSQLGHYIYWQPECWDRAFSHLVAQKRRPPPTTLRYATYSLRFPGAWWATLRAFRQWGKLATVAATAGGPGTGQIDLQSENVAALALAPRREWASPDGAFTVTWNGRKLARAKPDADGVLALVAADWQPPAPGTLSKTTTACGPLMDVLNFPFVVVTGTTGSAEENRANAELAARFVTDWEEYAEGNLDILKDTEVTESIIRDKSLILAGLPDTHAILRRCDDKLPFKLTRDTIALPDGKTYPARGTGLLLTYPNPLNPKRYIVILHGLHGGEDRSNNHRFDRFADFSIFVREPLPGINVNRFLAAGFFDGRWQYDPGLTDFDPAAGQAPRTDAVPPGPAAGTGSGEQP